MIVWLIVFVLVGLEIKYFIRVICFNKMMERLYSNSIVDDSDDDGLRYLKQGSKILQKSLRYCFCFIGRKVGGWKEKIWVLLKKNKRD